MSVSVQTKNVDHGACANCKLDAGSGVLRVTDEIQIWTVHESPPGYPGHFVARLWVNEQATGVARFATTLAAIREKLPSDLSMTPCPESGSQRIREIWR